MARFSGLELLFVGFDLLRGTISLFLESRAICNALFQPLARLFKRAIAFLDLAEHFVETVKKKTDFVVIPFFRSQGIVFAEETANAVRAKSNIGSEMRRCSRAEEK